MRWGQDAGWREEGFVDIETCGETGVYMIRDRRNIFRERSNVPHQFTIRSASPK